MLYHLILETINFHVASSFFFFRLSVIPDAHVKYCSDLQHERSKLKYQLNYFKTSIVLIDQISMRIGEQNDDCHGHLYLYRVTTGLTFWPKDLPIILE